MSLDQLIYFIAYRRRINALFYHISSRNFLFANLNVDGSVLVLKIINKFTNDSYSDNQDSL